jgi:hypothetical protein
LDKWSSQEGAGNVACIGAKEMHIGIWWESQKDRDYYKDLDIGGWIILR